MKKPCRRRSEDMKAFFVFQDKLKLDESGNIYTGTCFSESVWKRYTDVFDDFEIGMRKEERIYPVSEARARFNPFPDNQISVRYLPDLTRLSASSFFSPKAHGILREELSEGIENADCVIIRGENRTAVQIARKTGRPYLIEVVGCSFDSYWFHSLKGKIVAPLKFLQMKGIVKKAPFVIYVTYRYLQKRYPTKGYASAIPDVQIEKPDRSALEKRINKLSANQKPFVIGTAAAVNVVYKGHEYVIKALAELKMQGRSDFIYELAGSGDTADLTRLAQRLHVAAQVVFLGALPYSDMPAWFDHIDIYIQPSLTEGMPRAVIEAMSRGCTCLGSDVGGIPELLEKEFLFPKKNILKIADILAGLKPEQLIEQAVRNFGESQQYYAEDLDRKRSAFLQEFARECSLRMGKEL